jgi:hypothetical protein
MLRQKQSKVLVQLSRVTSWIKFPRIEALLLTELELVAVVGMAALVTHGTVTSKKRSAKCCLLKTPCRSKLPHTMGERTIFGLQEAISLSPLFADRCLGEVRHYSHLIIPMGKVAILSVPAVASLEETALLGFRELHPEPSALQWWLLILVRGLDTIAILRLGLGSFCIGSSPLSCISLGIARFPRLVLSVAWHQNDNDMAIGSITRRTSSF